MIYVKVRSVIYVPDISFLKWQFKKIKIKTKIVNCVKHICTCGKTHGVCIYMHAG